MLYKPNATAFSSHKRTHGVLFRAGAGLKSAGSGWARALRCGLGLLLAWPSLGGRLGVWPAGLAQKPGPRGLGLLGYVVKARAWARSGPFLLPFVIFHINTSAY
jgi:hypothetical protein